jgi:hypothetical protein
MDRMQPDNPLADVMRSRRAQLPQRIEAIAAEVRDEPGRDRPRRQRQRAPQPVALPENVSLRQLLGSRAAVRKAIILSEIIGPPKALRQDD